MTGTSEVAKGLMESWQKLSLDLFKTRSKIDQLEAHKFSLLADLGTILKTFEVIGYTPKDLIIPPELMFDPDASIGDTMEKLLRERGPMPKTELRTLLEGGGILTGKNTRIILSNAIKRDGRKRFKVKGGKVFLVKDGGPSFKILERESERVTRGF